MEGAASRPREVVLVIDGIAAMTGALEASGRRLHMCATGAEGLAFLEKAEPDVIVVTLSSTDTPGLRLVEALRAQSPSTPILVVTEAPTVEGAVAALRAGAGDYLGPEALGAALVCAFSEGERAVATETTIAERYGFAQALTFSPKMTRVFDAIRAVAQTDATVLVRGEAGSGRELVAHGIHERSRRRGRRLVGINCGALSEAELLTELFGHARTGEPGAFELAEGGTLFLDELGEASLSVQVQLLRALEARRFTRVGGGEIKKLNVRVIAATDADLAGAVADGRFREDLYYRLNVFPIAVPPLRERVEDIPLLVRRFLDDAAREYDLSTPDVTPDAMTLLIRYGWPGNVRQVRSLCERWVIECRGAPLGPEGLPTELSGVADPGEGEPDFVVDETIPLATLTARMTMQLERAYLHKLLAHHGGHLQNTATAAGMTRRTLYSRMKALGIEAREYK